MRGTAPTRVAVAITVTLLGGLTACGDDARDAGAGGETTASSSPAPTSVVPSSPVASSSATSPSGGTPTPESTASGSRCATADLAGSLVPGEPGAGQRYAQLVLTNTGDETCDIHGYGGAELRAADGEPLPTDLVRAGTKPPQTVTLAPGESASSQLHWSVVAGEGDSAAGDCQPVAAVLAVIPPDETASLDIAWDLGPVCSRGTIDQLPYAAG